MAELIPATTPPAGTPVPRPIRTLADGRPTQLIWENRLGGLTALVKDHAGDVVVKWQPNNPEASLAAEAKRLLAARPAPGPGTGGAPGPRRRGAARHQGAAGAVSGGSGVAVASG